ncbi:MAG TPA: citrate lyase holo-[acyl-carrier protein] synthase [Sphaerochaeta sp.]|nr:citrate lyase holo-[acyl-carrier protein] synthase [Sphaerochaeta sp.]
MATLEEILQAREDRCAMQTSLIEKHMSPLVSCTMNIPGPHKNSDLIQACFDKAMEAFVQRNQGVLEEVLEQQKETGPERYFIVLGGTNLYALKRRLAFFEQVFPIGRWLDLDLKDSDGIAITRKDITLEQRRCLLCNRPAKECARSERHSLEDLLALTEKELVLFLKKM